MKSFCIGWFVLMARLVFAADGPTFNRSLPKFQLPNETIVWAVPTNNRPVSLWVYKVVPQTFPEGAISNLMVMGSLTMKDRPPGALFRLSTTNYRRSLTIDPNQGRIDYRNEEVLANGYDKKTHTHQPVEGLPSDAEAERLGLRLLNEFGISRSDLVTKPGTTNLLTFGEAIRRSYLDKARNVNVENEAMSRGIFFSRRIDGINFTGIGVGAGAEVEFANHAKITRFKLVWRNLQPYEHRNIASPEEIIRWIREGKAVMTHKNIVNPKEINKLTITEMVPLYMGAMAEERQDFVYPFAQLEAIADIGTTNVSIQLHCPILEAHN